MQEKKKQLNRDAYISEAFRDYLREKIKGFSKQRPESQIELTRMVMNCGTRYLAHSHYPGWSFFTFENLEAKFGREKFKGINSRLGIFEFKMEWSKTEGRTKPYKLTPLVDKLRTDFFSQPLEEPTGLLAEYGDVRHKAPKNAIIAKARTHTGKLATKKGWKVPVLSAVPVNQHKLKKLKSLMEAELEKFGNGQPTVSPVDVTHAMYVVKDIQLILHYAHNNVKPSCVIHKYEQSASGRMYCKDVNLQTVQRQVRYAALHGLWDYDIENCHYSILQQMAQKAGHDCKAITYYLKYKSKVRGELAAQFGVTVTQIKKVLLALVYGASLSEDPDAAIPDALGSVDIANAVYDHPTFSALAKDIADARTAILKRSKEAKVFRGGIKNIRGLVMKVEGKKERHLLAHLLQGVESVALNAAHDLYASQIVLLQHDGFTATSPDLNIAEIEKAIFEATNYHLTVARDGPIKYDLKSALFDTDKFSIPTHNACQTPIHAGLPPNTVD